MTVRIPENIERVQQAFKAIFIVSLHYRLACQTGQFDNFHPKNGGSRTEGKWLCTVFMFAETMLETLGNDCILIMSNKAHFHLSGAINKQNCQHQSESPSKAFTVRE